MFVRLGILSFWRNRHRSGVGVVSIALAAMVFVSATLLAQGMPGAAFRAERQFLGGDIIVLGFKLPNAFELTDPTQRWTYQFMDRNLATQIDQFRPALLRSGALAQPGIHPLDQSVLDELQSEDGVRYVYPYRRLPVIVYDSQGQHMAYLRARNPQIDQALGFPGRVTAGRYFGPEDGGQNVALVDGFRSNVDLTNANRFGFDQFNGKCVAWVDGKAMVTDYSVPGPGATLRLRVPRWVNGGDFAVADFSDLSDWEFRVIGNYTIPTRTVHWMSEQLTLDGIDTTQRTDDDYPDHYSSEQLYWSTAELLVPRETFDHVADVVYPGGQLPIFQVAVGVNNFAQVNAIAERLRARWPQLTVLTVPQLTQVADVMPEPMFETPPEDIRSMRSAKPSFHVANVQLPSWVRDSTILLLYLVGGMMLAGNVYVALLLRKKELGLFLALGARRYQVVIVVLTEVLLIGISGALLGFLLMTPVALWQYLSNRAGAGVIAAALGQNLGLLIATTVAASAAFGAIPAWLASRLPVSEVLISE